jgi:hypothetical protein
MYIYIYYVKTIHIYICITNMKLYIYIQPINGLNNGFNMWLYTTNMWFMETGKVNMGMTWAEISCIYNQLKIIIWIWSSDHHKWDSVFYGCTLTKLEGCLWHIIYLHTLT